MKIGQRDLLVRQQKGAEARKAKAEAQLGEFDLVQILLQKQVIMQGNKQNVVLKKLLRQLLQSYSIKITDSKLK